jgi:hypothetical protein
MRIGRKTERAAVLVEVVLALLLFVGAVAVVASALNASMDSVQRQKFSMHAANLAASVHAELDMGLRSTEALGPEVFAEPFQDWTWQLAQTESQSETGEASGLTSVEVVIRNTTTPAVYRVAQLHKIQMRVAVPAAAGGASGAEEAP